MRGCERERIQSERTDVTERVRRETYVGAVRGKKTCQKTARGMDEMLEDREGGCRGKRFGTVKQW